MTSIRPHHPTGRSSAPAAVRDDRRLRVGTAVGLPVVLAVAFALTVGTAAMVEAATSPLGLLTVLVALAAWVGIAWFVLPRLARATAPRLGLVLIAGLVAAAVTILPYYRGVTAHDALPTGPTEVSRGDVVGIGHHGSGRAVLLRLADGQEVLRFENLDVDNAPDMQVYLVPGHGKESPGGGPRLGGLKGNRGDQNYPVARGKLPTGPVTALIYCRAFSVPIAAAALD